MCELFGICAKEPVSVNAWLHAFYRHSEEHRDGWGLAVFYDHGMVLEKEPVKAADSRYLNQRLSADLSVRNLFAHIRKATVGQIAYANCHPFARNDSSGRTWTLMHNGTMFNSACIFPYLADQEGTTDSERILLCIIDHIRAFQQKHGRIPDAGERFMILDDLIRKMAEGNKLNLMLFDGDTMYVHTNCKDTLFSRSIDGAAIFATKPVLTEGWKAVPANQLLAYRDGTLVRKGIPHSLTYIDNEHDLLTLYAAYAEL